MRGLGIFPRAVRFDSADSCNVAVNSHRHKAAHGENRVRFLARRTRDKVLDAVAQAREFIPQGDNA
jgi:predicted ThiF/HesA family dinucleotide-utilizing enzyme